MVAGAAKADLLADLYKVVETSISDGKSIQWFRANFDEIVEKHGWSYRGERNWRTRVIYQTNISTSYAAGREAQIAAGGFPFKMYKHSDSVMHPRPLHQSWDGLVLPVDHPFWLTHSAPNGWGCKCRIIGIRNEAAARRMGGKWGAEPPADWKEIDPKTGEQIGIDRGWGYAPGATVVRDVLSSISSKHDARSYQVAAPLMAAMAREFSKNGVLDSWLAKPDGDFPLAVLPDADLSAIGAKNRTVRFSADTAAKQIKVHPEITSAEYAKAQDVVDRGQRIQDSASSLVYVLENADGYVMAVKATATGEAVFMTSFRRLSKDQAKRDAELRRLLKKAEGK